MMVVVACAGCGGTAEGGPFEDSTQGLAPAANGLRGTYFNARDLSSPRLTRLDPQVSFRWGRGAPAAGLRSDNFSVRWTGFVVPRHSETYTFTVRSDDGARLWVDGLQLVNTWGRRGLQQASGTVTLEAGRPYALRLEYNDAGQEAQVALLWSSAGQPSEVVPAASLFADDPTPPPADAGSGEPADGGGPADAGTPDAGTGPGDGGAGDGGYLPPGDAGTAQVRFTVHTGQDVHPISPYIYGANMVEWDGWSRHLTLSRLGGNRWTAYNWETNASNAGVDWFHQNDNYLCDWAGCEQPGEAVRAHVAAAHAAGASMLVTVPIVDHVAADTRGDGDVSRTPDYLDTRFKRSRPAKGAPLTLTPDASDAAVYQDEFVHWLETRFPHARSDPRRTIMYLLDNEPDLWAETHVRIHPDKPTYAELARRSTETARAIKAVAPSALVMGPVNYGWYGFVSLQGAPDANGRDFLDFYLAAMRQEEASGGRRLLDVLDLHWYPEAEGEGRRIIDANDATGAEARMQAPRSLWDPGYTESSWITQYSTLGPIRLLPRLREKVAQHYPGTRLSFSEYNYGGGTHVSGAVAQADVLGIFGREDVFAATQWNVFGDQPFVHAAFQMFRNYDGQGGRFGDTSVRAVTSDPVGTSVYASVDAANPGRVVLVAINKSGAPVTTSLSLTHTVALRQAAVYALTGARAAPVPQGAVTLGATNALTYTLPATSVTTFVLTP
jgi:hypothetical protein